MLMCVPMQGTESGVRLCVCRAVRCRAASLESLVRSLRARAPTCTDTTCHGAVGPGGLGVLYGKFQQPLPCLQNRLHRMGVDVCASANCCAGALHGAVAWQQHGAVG